jgi:hypothetical protein
VSWLQFIGTELRQLRVELLERRAATDRNALEVSEHKLAAVQADQNRWKNQEDSLKHQLADLDRHAEQAVADPQSRIQVQTVKNELASEGAERLRLARSELAAQEAEARDRLSAAKIRLQTVLDRLKQLKSNVP